MIFSQNYFKIRVLGMTSYLHLSYHTPTRFWGSGGLEGFFLGGGGIQRLQAGRWSMNKLTMIKLADA